MARKVLMKAPDKILLYLVQHGPANKYRIRKESDAGTQPTVYDGVKHLKLTGMIKEVKPETERRKVSTNYDLTVGGLLRVIVIGKMSNSQYDHILAKYPYLLHDLIDWCRLIQTNGLELKTIHDKVAEYMVFVHNALQFVSNQRKSPSQNYRYIWGLVEVASLQPELFNEFLEYYKVKIAARPENVLPSPKKDAKTTLR
jgi:hypothetical protein